MGSIIDGREISKKYKEEIKDFVSKLKPQGKRPPCLCTILVGNDGGSAYYVKNQTKLCDTLGVTSKNYILKEETKEEELISLISELNTSKEVDGIMLQVPLPKHINEKKVTSLINPLKDVDGLTEINTGKFYKGDKCFVPCTPRSVIELLKSSNVTLEGSNAVVIGRSNIVGKPVAALLTSFNATVTICHSRTKNLKEICKRADILVCAMGRPSFVNEEFIKEGAVVIDVGTTMVDGKIQGDVDFESVKDKASKVTPVPGGVGSLTTTMLIKNTCEAFLNNVC